MRKLLLLVLLLSVVVCGCDKIFPSKTPATPVTNTQPQQEMIKISGPLLARVNNWAIGTDDFKSYLDNLRPLATAQNLDIDSFEFKQRLLNDLVKNEILAQLAVKRGLDKDEDFRKALRDTKSTLLASKIRSDLENKVIVSYSEIENFYEQNKFLLRKPQEMKIRELAVSSESTAKDIAIRLLQGESFASLARQFSALESSSKGGDLGYITYNPQEKFQKYWEVVLSLDKGQNSSIFRGDDGNYYILKLEDLRGGQEIPLSEVENELREGLKRDKIEQELNNMVDSFKTNAKVEVNEDLLR